jgi:hypothetical protein
MYDHYGTAGQTAPEFRFEDWLDNADGDLRIADIDEPVIYLYNFQSWSQRVNRWPAKNSATCHWVTTPASRRRSCRTTGRAARRGQLLLGLGLIALCSSTDSSSTRTTQSSSLKSSWLTPRPRKDCE